MRRVNLWSFMRWGWMLGNHLDPLCKLQKKKRKKKSRWAAHLCRLVRLLSSQLVSFLEPKIQGAMLQTKSTQFHRRKREGSFQGMWLSIWVISCREKHSKLETPLWKHAYSNRLQKKKKKKKKKKKIEKSDIFHISAQIIDCGYSLEPPRLGSSNEYPQSMF